MANNGFSYLIGVEGLSSKYRWQDLKDLLRQAGAMHGVWANMEANGRGWVRGNRREEGLNAYTYLIQNPVDNRRLQVHLFDTSGTEPQLWRCNCNVNHSGRRYDTRVYQVNRLNAPGWQPLLPESQPAPSMQAVTGPVYNTYSPSTSASYLRGACPVSSSNGFNYAFANLSLDPSYSTTQINPQSATVVPQIGTRSLQSQAHRTSAQYSSAQSSFIMQQNGVPVNNSKGLVNTEARGVHVSQLSYKARAADIVEFFSTVGKVEKCDVPKDPATGKLRGYAIIEYASAAQAWKAQRDLDGKILKQKQIKVRILREQKAINPPREGTPVIVNGSQSNEGWRKSRNDSAVSFSLQ